MKGIRTYLGLALLLSVAVAPNAFSMEENLSSELQEVTQVVATEAITPAVEMLEEISEPVVEAVNQGAAVAQDRIPGMSRYEQFKTFASDMRPSWNPRGWGQKFGSGLSAKAVFAKDWAKENLNKESLRNLAGQAKAWGVSKKDAILQAPYKAIANGALEYTKTQAAANKAVIVGGVAAGLYELGAFNLAAKPVVYGAKGVKAGAQKALTGAKNHKKVTAGLGVTTLAAASGLGYYFNKYVLANAAQSFLSYVQPAMTVALESKSEIGKTAGAFLVGVAAIEAYKGARAFYKQHLAQEKRVLSQRQYEVNKDVVVTVSRKSVLNRLSLLAAQDINDLMTKTTRLTSQFFQARISLTEKKLFTKEELEAIKRSQQNFNAQFNCALYLKTDKAWSSLLDVADLFNKACAEMIKA